MSSKQSNPVPIYQLKVTLKHIRPPVWRRLQVKGDMTLYKLHQTLQTAMGWLDEHLHQFVVHGAFYGEPEVFGDMLDTEMVSERKTRLNQIVGGVKDKFVYEYDFGDGWEHEILVENILEPEPRTKYPRCLKGKRSCPPEDVGGPWGYQNFLEAIRDEQHPEHDDYLDWIGGGFDPEAFDLEAVNQELKRIR